MRVLVIGGTGTVGSALVQRLVQRGIETRVMTRSPEGEIRTNVEVVAGDLEDAGTLPAVFEGVDRAYLLTPLHPRESELGRAAIRAATKAGIGRLVLQSIHNAESAPHVPHFRSKIEMEEALRESGIPGTVVAPSSFYQNDLRYRDAIVQHGVYPQPIGSAGLSRVDVADIADVAAAALLEESQEDRTIPVVGPDPLTGEWTAEIWSDHVGRDVAYIGDDLQAWTTQVRGSMPDWMVGDLVMMYRFFQEKGLVASDEDLATMRDVLGREPRSFDNFAAEAAARWKGGD